MRKDEFDSMKDSSLKWWVIIPAAIVGLTSGTIISFGKMNASATIAVSEIWTEKI